MKTIEQLRFLIRFICIGGFIFLSLVPLYVPQSALSSEAPEHYLTSNQFLLVEEGFVMKTASISEAGHRLAYSKGISHDVGGNESLSSISKLYNVSIETIRWANNLNEKAVLHPGDTLLILPVDGVLHIVKRGQSLLKIATLYDTSIDTIISQNQLTDERIFAGQQIIIPQGQPLIETSTSKPVQVAVRGRTETEPEPPRPTQPPDAAPPPSFGIFQKPCDCTYTQYYRVGHYAVDMARRGGGPIFAAEDGIVIRADYGWNGGYGNVIEIDHGNGLVTLYAHNRSLHVREGSAVRRGDVIASMGNTGKVYGQTGIHLHFEAILRGVKKNPLLYLQ
jgi:murein DD-endopeptidase MepM/ murein hydrolase activator NlpD